MYSYICSCVFLVWWLWKFYITTVGIIILTWSIIWSLSYSTAILIWHIEIYSVHSYFGYYLRSCMLTTGVKQEYQCFSYSTELQLSIWFGVRIGTQYLWLVVRGDKTGRSFRWDYVNQGPHNRVTRSAREIYLTQIWRLDEQKCFKS